MRDLGYSKDLFILPFDHRGSFEKNLLNIKGRPPTNEERRNIASYKTLIYDAFKKALEKGVANDVAGILVDEQYGAAIAKDARENGYLFAMAVEKSGQDEFDFEYGNHFEEHVREFEPTFIKALARYNPEADPALNHRQLERLKRLSDFCHRENYKLMFELLIPATSEQLQRSGGAMQYDAMLRPALMRQAMQEIQRAGIEPDLWKVEGVEEREDSRMISAQARNEGREHVGVILLGRGENAEKVRRWIETAALTEGITGFAIGRTVFWDALKEYKERKIARERAVEAIADTYRGFCELWLRSKRRH